MKTLSLILLLIFASATEGFAFSSSDSLDTSDQYKKHMIDLELSGNSFPYSFGYTYSINPRWEIRAGFGYISFPGFNDNPDDEEPRSYFRALNVPLLVNHLRGDNHHKLELKAGIRFDKLESQFGIFEYPLFNQWYLTPTAGAGYRRNGNRNVFGVHLSLSYFAYLDGLSLLPSLGLRYGYRF